MSDSATPPAKKAKNLTTNYSTETREVLGRMRALAPKHGIRKADYDALVLEAVPGFGKRSLRRYSSAIEQGTSVFTPDKATGRASKLSAEQKQIGIGFCLHEISERHMVTRQTLKTFFQEKFGVDVTLQTCGNVFKKYCMTRRALKVRTAGYTKTDEELIAEYRQFVVKIRVIIRNHVYVASVDFTYTGHRTERVYGYAPRGTKAPKVDRKITQFTNCIVTIVWHDSVNRTPAMLFSTNRDFMIGGGKRKDRAGRMTKFEETCRKYGISQKRCVYKGNKLGKKKTFQRETDEILKDMLDFYADVIPADTIFLSDNGNAFQSKENGEPIDLLTYKDYVHEFYPADVHQWLSPNDNKLHGAAKARWRASGVDLKNDVEACVVLLKYLDEETTKSSGLWFKQNMFLDGGRVTDDDILKVMGGSPTQNAAMFRACHKKYCKVILKEKSAIDKLEDELDGSYWVD